MPELPEVQTIVDDLNKKVAGRRIISVWHHWPKAVVVQRTVGATIERVRRFGKNIFFYLSGGNIFLVHQKMTGHLLVGRWERRGKNIKPLAPEAMKQKVNGYLRFILTLDDGWMIGLSDMRKFAKVVFGSAAAVENLPEVRGLGPDALQIGLKDFIQRVGNHSKTIYQVLMDQAVVAGIGNIYVSDILWQSRVHPFLSAKKLTPAQLKILWMSARKILALALKLRGTSTSDFRDTAGQPGGYGPKRLAYGREGLPCYRCGSKIQRVKKGGRSAHFCPRCQTRTHLQSIFGRDTG